MNEIQNIKECQDWHKKLTEKKNTSTDKKIKNNKRVNYYIR